MSSASQTTLSFVVFSRDYDLAPRNAALFVRELDQGSTTMRYKDWKLRMPTSDPKNAVLYNIALDPPENKDLPALYPDVVEKMTGSIVAQLAELPTSYARIQSLKRIKKKEFKAAHKAQ